MTTRLLRDPEHLREVLGIPFSDEQMDAITSPTADPSVIVAGAGSGKTTVMAARVVWMVGHEGIDPASILGLTFTNKAAAELSARVRRALQSLADAANLPGHFDEQGSPTVSTYHAYAGSLITEYGLLLGLEPDLRVISDASRFQRAARAIGSHRGQIELLSTHLPTLVGNVLALDGQMSDHLATPDDVRAFGRTFRAGLETELAGPKPLKLVTDAIQTSRRRDELVDLVERYRSAKVEAGVLDFSDQMAWGARLAIECPEVSAAQRERFTVVLLDEYQDTSVAQRQMLQGLFSGETADLGRGHSVTAVGDPCQGIYGWRGAAADNLVRFLEHFPAAGDGSERGHAFGLHVNRRCGAGILDVANTLAAPYYATSEHVRPLVAPGDAEPGDVRAASFTTVVDELDWLGDQVVEAAERFDLSEIAILVRDKREIGAIAAVLRERGVPVEVLGLSGLLAQPEVEDVVATLDVIDDVTANPSLLRLLTGPRWRIGPRDLALLGHRARQLVATDRAREPDHLGEELARAVSGTDPTEVLSLADAVDSPGDLDYSDEAVARFEELSSLLHRLRRHVGESPTDLVRRVISALDLDIELAAMGGPRSAQALDNLALLVDAVADFVGTDASAPLSSLLAYLRAEDEFNSGMDVAAPSDAQSVKLLTAHKAKGLEWDAVLVPMLSRDVFPSSKARERWVTSPAELPGDLRGDADSQPQVGEWTTQGLNAYKQEGKDDAALEELRLGYVSLTRARSLLVTSGHHWGRSQKKPRGPSAYLDVVRQWLSRHGGEASPWAAAPDDGDGNPLLAEIAAVQWPAALDGSVTTRRHAAAAAVRDHLATPGVGPVLDQPAVNDAPLDDDAAAAMARLEVLDTEIELLLAEARESREGVVEVELPATMSPTRIMQLNDDPDAFARSLVRPMPRRPSSAARFGTRFHAWVEAHFQQQALLDEGDLPGRDLQDIDDESELLDLIESFRGGPYADRPPLAVEAAFSLRLGGQLVHGRIDAVYQTDTGYEVVDWKTNRTADADPLQLAIYRLAWAEMHGLDPDAVTAAFYYVRLGTVEHHDDLPGRDDLEAVIVGQSARS